MLIVAVVIVLTTTTVTVVVVGIDIKFLLQTIVVRTSLRINAVDTTMATVILFCQY